MKGQRVVEDVEKVGLEECNNHIAMLDSSF